MTDVHLRSFSTKAVKAKHPCASAMPGNRTRSRSIGICRDVPGADLLLPMTSSNGAQSGQSRAIRLRNLWHEHCAQTVGPSVSPGRLRNGSTLHLRAARSAPIPRRSDRTGTVSFSSRYWPLAAIRWVHIPSLNHAESRPAIRSQTVT